MSASTTTASPSSPSEPPGPGPDGAGEVPSDQAVVVEARRSAGIGRRLQGLRVWWDGVPMRARLVSILVVLLVASLAITGWTVQHVLRGYLVGQVDGRLTTSAHQLVVQSRGPDG